ncbi:MAG: hypothetical protein AB4058_08690 [Microcystaceae cyanobacterium]
MSDLERLESIKAGILGAIAFTFSYLLLEGLRVNLASNLSYIPNGWIKVPISLITGALFTITYRYILQGTDNPHLKEGAVFAFGLVRGFVPVESTSDILNHWGELSLILGENLLSFLLTRMIIDWAFERGWIKN